MSEYFRHEYKYICSEAQLQLIEHRLRQLCATDVHADAQGHYRIRSMYFDDPEHHCYLENENGTDPREKYRIRIYDASPKVIHLERKRKVRGMTHKDSCSLSKEVCDALLAGGDVRDIRRQPVTEETTAQPMCNPEKWKSEEVAIQEETTMQEEQSNVTSDLLTNFLQKYESERFRPDVIVEYDRTTFVHPVGNVRITLDRNICSAGPQQDFWSEMLQRRPVLPAGKQLLEVKYDALLPDVIYRALSLENLQRTSFSKFYLCAKYRA